RVPAGARRRLRPDARPLPRPGAHGRETPRLWHGGDAPRRPPAHPHVDRARDRLRHRGQERRRPPEPPRSDPRRGRDRDAAPRRGPAGTCRRVRAGGVTLANEIARFCRITWDRGLVSAAGGNLSARIGDTDTFLITPSGVALRDAEPDDLVTIDLAGRKL